MPLFTQLIHRHQRMHLPGYVSVKFLVMCAQKVAFERGIRLTGQLVLKAAEDAEHGVGGVIPLLVDQTHAEQGCHLHRQHTYHTNEMFDLGRALQRLCARRACSLGLGYRDAGKCVVVRRDELTIGGARRTKYAPTRPTMVFAPERREHYTATITPLHTLVRYPRRRYRGLDSPVRISRPLGQHHGHGQRSHSQMSKVLNTQKMNMYHIYYFLFRTCHTQCTNNELGHRRHTPSPHMYCVCHVSEEHWL